MSILHYEYRMKLVNHLMIENTANKNQIFFSFSINGRLLCLRYLFVENLLELMAFEYVRDVQHHSIELVSRRNDEDCFDFLNSNREYSLRFRLFEYFSIRYILNMHLFNDDRYICTCMPSSFFSLSVSFQCSAAHA